ncbi:MAG: homocysteine S-methyltransferase family protein [Treponema sp.]|jgi:5-methyltetrahydrofolate--homocysteine methyltransferase|nr:homocysteine S-methyltransferase family protein [Treponema sp.]
MSIRQQILSIAEKRILILDGAVGSLIQALNLGKICNDNLCRTNPQKIINIHNAYLEAGADIIETCSFNSTSVSLADYGLEHEAYEISTASARIARECADKYSTPDKPRFVAGSIGPTAKGASLYPDINNPGKRSIIWDELENAYYDNARGLLDGGADILIVETIFDTLNAKAAFFAISRLMEEQQIDIPVIVSVTISGEGGRLLSGQNLEAFVISVKHINPLAIGLNCSSGAEKLFPFVREISNIINDKKIPCLVIAYPNNGFPNSQGIYEETPEVMSNKIDAYFKEKLVNIIGGCCGTTPAHIETIAKKAADYSPREISHPGETQGIWLSGLEAHYIENIDTLPASILKIDAKDINEFRQALIDGEFENAADIARDIIDSGADILPIEIDDEKILNRFLDFALLDPYVSKVPFFLKSSNIKVLETGLKRLQGKALAGPIDNDNAKIIKRYGAYPVIGV